MCMQGISNKVGTGHVKPQSVCRSPVGSCSNKETTSNHQTGGGRAFQRIYQEG